MKGLLERNSAATKAPESSMSDASRSPSNASRNGRSVSRSHSRSSSPPRRRVSRSRSRDQHSPSRSPRSRSRTPIDGARLHISDIGYHISSRDLEREFRKYGRLMEVWMSKSRTSPTFAFVVYRHMKDAQKAMREMDGVSINGNRIRVSIARPRSWSSRKSGGGGGGGGGGFQSDLRCYSCGRRGHFARDCPDSMR
ncbi:hypothetical protein M8J76_001746 [Diaphorina citri]|nr:hypothetical protein M8J75_005874 [Diaphorina citri]KAI5744369.1 hypothetical protein M8J76_001746 [Diaphorina citri]